MIARNKVRLRSLILVLGLTLVFEGFLLDRTYTPRAWSQSGSGLIGYLWSDNIGWIDLNCLNTGSCATNPFGMSLDAGGNITGYAWSDNIGWITANPSQLTGCPSGSCTATIVGNVAAGWFRACGGMDDTVLNQATPNVTCSNGAGSRTDGWDGWISLGQQVGDTVNYHVYYNPVTDYFSTTTASSTAWGSTVVGWVDFALARESCTAGYSCSGNQPMYTTTLCQTSATGSPCTAYGQFCSGGACQYPQPSGSISVSPKIVVKGKPTFVTWSAIGVSTSTPCTISFSNSTSTWSGNSGTSATSSPLQAQTTFTLSCVPLDPNAPNPYKVSATASLVPNFVEQ